MKRLILCLIFLFPMVITQACFDASNHDKSTTLSANRQIMLSMQPYLIDLAEWEFNNFIKRDDSANTKVPYLKEQIVHTLQKNRLPVIPPVNFKIERPPYLLVISPRDKILYYDRILLRQDLSENEIEEAEKRVDALGFSSLVVELGGFGAAYPAIVSPNMELQQIINAAVEEWAHQHLAFKPLGFLYLIDSLGIRQDPEIIIMNESLAGIIADEIGKAVYENYYQSVDTRITQKLDMEFAFDAEMRKTRCEADRFLADGKIDEAESYMEQRRILFVQHGYHIRKLNQAYFAFHGIYGQDPGSVSPVYTEMKQLRAEYHTLADFVADVSMMKSHEELKVAVSRNTYSQ